MADMFAPLVAQLKANPKTIVFTEGNDPRILEAASKLLAEGVLKVVMVGNEAECKAAAAAGNFDISAAEIIDPENYAGFDEMVNTMVELRKGKQTAEECTALLKKSNYFGTMLVKMGKADCLLGGATYSTADTIRPALQLVKTKKGAHLVSSCFILDRDCGEEGLKRIAMGDCAVNVDYTDTVDKATGEVKVAASAKLAEVAVETAKTAKLFGIDPKVAVLSFSTKGSGKGGTVALSHDAVIKAQEMAPELAIDGELQFDAAVAPDSFSVSSTLPRTNSLIWPLITSSFSCTIFSDIVCLLLSEWCVVTSFYQSLQAMSSFMRFSICSSYCTSMQAGRPSHRLPPHLYAISCVYNPYEKQNLNLLA